MTDFTEDTTTAKTRRDKFPPNLASAVSSIDGQLDQLFAELDESNATARNRVRSIKNALAQIAPDVPPEVE